MLSRDSCLEPDTRNSFGMSGNVFVACQHGVNRQQFSLKIRQVLLRHNASPFLRRQGGLPPERMNWSGTLIILQDLHRDFARKFSTWNPPSHAEEAHPQNCIVDQPRNQVSEMPFDKFSNLSIYQCRKERVRGRGMFLFTRSHGSSLLWNCEVA